MAGAVLGAVIACAALVAATVVNPTILVDFETDLPRSVASGIYPAERTPDETFVWTGPLATFAVRGMDRDVAWRCSVRMRAARPAGRPQPQAAIGVDGATIRTVLPGGAYEDVHIDAPPSRAAALNLSISTNPTFVPGPGDKRELGVQLDRVSCAPAADAWVMPAGAALRAAAIAGAAFGALFTALSATLLLGIGGCILFSSALAFVLTTGLAAYLPPYLAWLAPVAFCVSGSALLLAVVRAWSGRPLHAAAAFVLTFSAAVLFIKILTLMHPSKELVDAVFHAHRLRAVLGGSYFFTQPMPGGVQFPYAIGLYVAAMPFADVVRDHVALLRIVVLLAESVAAALLYLAVARIWSDRLTAASAVVFYHLAPLPYVVIGNANLTYAFGQAVGVMTVAAAVALPFRARPVWSAVVLTALAALAFLSHVGVFPVLALTLLALGGSYAWLGGTDLRRAARGVLVAAFAAAVLAIGSYYAHFPEVYRTLDRVSAPVTQQQAEGASSAAAASPLPLSTRLVRAATLGLRAYGLPLLVLALAGVWLVWKGRSDALTCALAACGMAFAAFLVFRTIAPVDARLQRYADEFIDRLYYASLPAVAILAARAAASGWRGAAIVRLAATALVAAAIFIGVRQWSAWIR